MDGIPEMRGMIPMRRILGKPGVTVLPVMSWMPGVHGMSGRLASLECLRVYNGWNSWILGMS